MRYQTGRFLAMAATLTIGLSSCANVENNGTRHRTEADLIRILDSAPLFEGHPLRIMRSEQIRKTLSALDGLKKEGVAQPGSCLDLTLANALDLPEAEAVLAGYTGEDGSGPLVVSLLSGLDADAVDRAQHALASLVDRCPEVTVTTPADKIRSTGLRIDAPVDTAGTLGVQITHEFAGTEPIVTNFYTAVKNGVLITVQFTASKIMRDGDVYLAAGMLDSLADAVRP